MSLLVLSVTSINTDTSKAGTMLLNSNRVGPFKTTDTTSSLFEYNLELHSRKSHFERFIVSNDVATIASNIAANNDLVYALSAYEDNDASNSTSVIYVNTEEIAKGIAYGADSTKTWIWVEKTPGRVVKYLVNLPLQTLADGVNTGTTTTSTTSTSTTSTSTTSTTSTHT